MADDKIAARHDRLSNAGETRYDWQHYIPLLQRKPGALRNGAPFADMPEPLQRLRRGLLRNPGGDRVMAQVLAIVLTAGLEAVLVAVELALETGSPGKVSVEHTPDHPADATALNLEIHAMLIFRQLFDAASSTYTYLLGDADSGQAVLIDPVYEHLRRDGALLRELGRRPHPRGGDVRRHGHRR